MLDLSFKDFIFSYLQSEYKRFSKIITNTILHIEKLSDNNIINNNERIQYIKSINELIRELNDAYNNRLRKIQNEKIIEDDNIHEDKKVDNDVKNNKKDTKLDINVYNYFGIKSTTFNSDNLENNLIELLNINKVFNVQKYKDFYIEDFEQVRKKLIKIGNMIGFYNLDDALNILVGYSYKKLFTKNIDTNNILCLEILNDLFIPLSLNIKKLESHNKENLIKSFMKDSEYDTILENFAEIEIKIKGNNVIYTFEGYYIHEPINSILRNRRECMRFFIQGHPLEFWI